MAFDHENMAVQGLYPGLVTTSSVANLGHFKIEITVSPLGRGGPADTTDLSKKKDKYLVTIRVTYKTRVYEYSREVGKWEANVYAKMLGVELMTPPDPTITMESVTVKQPEEITVEVTKR